MTGKTRPGFTLSLIFGLLFTGLGVWIIATGNLAWGIATAILGIGWIIYAIWRRQRLTRR